MSAFSSKLSSKAQTVVPKEIRERLGLKPGDTVRYRVTEDGVLLEKARSEGEDDPFATFVEWGTEEDDRAFADL